ncbi:site-specific DNA-methyltransferase [Peptostreptococcus porci]|uniref:DNA-methyltransferase n=1 Tax=Peptostreptococcus porci TaxID=2652282 RepID=UPI002A7FC4B9|nr:site-specific DNA-methyltransferase [Peptostreptococcus porci]MDY4127705.1 site-specific DNA-methyltransferase [Peptostreptococcus porci]
MIIEKGNYKLYNGDCLEVMDGLISLGVKFDAIIADPPYGTTACKWDSVIPLDDMWLRLNKLIKHNGVIAVFGNEPFTSVLISSNLKGFKYRWDWNKKIPSGMGYAKYRPMQQTEDICIFTKNGEKTVYNPQMIRRDKPIKSGGNTIQAGVYSGFKCMGEGKEYKKTYEYKNPVTLIEFDKIRKGSVHPTQKPVALLEYLIKTYTNEGDLVLDFTMGSGSTGVACLNTNRRFIGIELDEKYFGIAKERLQEVE